MPKLDFKYDKERDVFNSLSEINNIDSNLSFKVRAYVDKHNLLSITFNFGRTKLNAKTLYYINQFNQKSPEVFKAYILTDEQLGSFFIIDFNKTIRDVDNAFFYFVSAMEFLNNSQLTEYIEPVYEICNFDRTNIKEMN